jgi:hypothetical protein
MDMPPRYGAGFSVSSQNGESPFFFKNGLAERQLFGFIFGRRVDKWIVETTNMSTPPRY